MMVVCGREYRSSLDGWDVLTVGRTGLGCRAGGGREVTDTVRVVPPLDFWRSRTTSASQHQPNLSR